MTQDWGKQTNKHSKELEIIVPRINKSVLIVSLPTSQTDKPGDLYDIQ